MIRHVVLLRWTDSPTAEELAAMEAVLGALPAQIPELVSYEYGADLELVEGTFDYAITATFARTEDYFTYRDHPAHQALVADHVSTRVAARATAQFSLADRG